MLHEEFKRRIETQTVLSCAEMAAMLFRALLVSGRIVMRRSTAGSPCPKPSRLNHDLAA
jgi:putative transposase